MKKTLLAVTAAVLGLSACSNLNNKTPQEMMTISMERSLTKDYSYNFESNARFFLSDKDKGLAPEMAAEMAAETEKKFHDKLDNSESEIELSEIHDLIKERFGRTVVDFAQSRPVMTEYFQNVQINMKGAVDLHAEKIEFIPEIVNNNKNEYSKIQIPMLLDGKNMTVTVDLPATLPMLLDIFLENKELTQRLAGQGIRLDWKDLDKAEIPLRSAIKAFIKSSYTAYKDIPSDAYQLIDMDKFGRQAGAKYHINIIWNNENLKTYYDNLYRDFDNELTRMQQEDFEKGATEEGYQQVHEIVAKIFGKTTEQDADSGSYTFNFFERIFGSPMIESIYLDGKGRMVARRTYSQVNGEEKAINIEMSTRLNHFGNPVFTFQPDQEKVVTLPELIGAFKLGPTNVDEDQEEDDENIRSLNTFEGEEIQE
ncbi:hypothetical protein [Neisseria montereyensis]|uniref:Lipoprotein n=1 Tax=Neisseria montereyensis TaxID=2973938 RepID=A0ABT2FGJ0_9NEIS|nr:hypothetical protein [Neisseria montereyensis]MCS4534689.1 hypothetical protein [Neisseria montereyensis]